MSRSTPVESRRNAVASREHLRMALASFSVTNYRRFIAGQSVSLVGSWTETVAQALLVLQLTDSGLILGLVTATRYLPVLLLSPYAGVLVDRHNKRRLLLITQSSLAILSAITGTLVLLHVIQVWMLFGVAVGFGLITAVDNPARQAFVREIVGHDLLRNAVTLNSTFVNVGRAVGPVVAAVLTATIGIGWCFVVNAVSFAAVLFSLTILRLRELHTITPAPRKHHELVEGLRYAAGRSEILVPLVMMALIGTLTYEFEVSLPLFATQSFATSAEATSWLLGAFGAGSVIGGIYCIWRPGTGIRRLRRATVGYAAALFCAALAPNLPLAVATIAAAGFASITFLTTGNSTIQLAADPTFLGRVTALWSTAFLGSTPIGAAIIGAIGAESARVALAVGGIACAAAIVAAVAISRRRPPDSHLESAR